MAWCQSSLRSLSVCGLGQDLVHQKGLGEAEQGGSLQEAASVINGAPSLLGMTLDNSPLPMSLLSVK